MQNTQRTQAIDILKSPADYSLEAVSAALRMIRLKDDTGGADSPNTQETGGNHERTSH